MKHLGTILLVAFLILVIVLSVVRLGMREDTSYTETLECQVLDKFYLSNKGGCTYYVVLLAAGTYAEIEDSFHVSEETFYKKIKIGDTFTCTITYDEEGILELTDHSGTLAPYSRAEGAKTAALIMGGFVLFVAAVFGLILGPPFIMARLNERSQKSAPQYQRKN